MAGFSGAFRESRHTASVECEWMTLLLLIILPFAGSLLAALLPTTARNREAWLAGFVAVAGLLLTASLYPAIQVDSMVRVEFAWMPAIDLNVIFRVDGLAWLFLLLIFGIGALVTLYARYYLSPEDPAARFFGFLLAFMGAMVGVVTAGNLLQLALFWELTSLVSFMLIGYWHHRADARRGARMALTVTAAGGLCLLGGLLLLGHIVGSYDLDRVLEPGDRVRAHPWYLPTLILIALGALTKSAQFPFQFWLPNAMAAPTPVSAYLHSATMVKLGVFLLARFWPVLAGTDAWFWIIGGAGLCSLLLGAYTALFQQDLKGVLAYSTISHLGLITLLLGLNSPLAAVAAVFHIMNHATFKASLFMAAGIVDHEAGTRDLRKLGGLRKSMPITFMLAAVASAAMAGVPLLNGFLSKEMFFAETVYVSAQPWMRVALPVAATLAGIFSVAYSLRLVYAVFFGQPAAELPRVPHEPPRWMRFPVELLVVICLVVGILPEWSVGRILEIAATSLLQGSPPEYSLAIWHGLNLPLMMSIVALIFGTLLYRLIWRYLRGRTSIVAPVVRRLDGRRIYQWVMIGLTRGARRLQCAFTSRRLQTQLLLVIVLALMFGTLSMLAAGGISRGPSPPTSLNPVFVVVWAVGMTCAVGAAWQAKYHRLAALMMLGGAGLVTCLTYVWFSAPDLALTQLMVETVTTVLMLLGLRWLPKRLPEVGRRLPLRTRARRLRDMLVAIAAGGGVGALAFAVLTRPFPQSMASQYLERSIPEGGGANTVNVIIVDFRGFDTMGEIVVLGAVALTVYALLRRFRPPPEIIETQHVDARVAVAEEEAEDEAMVAAAEGGAKPRRSRHVFDSATGDLVLPAVILRLMMPMAGMVSVYLFLRGHNSPGGGFVAGLVFAVAIIMQYMVSGTDWVEAHMTLRPVRWIAGGVLLAALTGLSALLWQQPFLTSQDVHWHLPLVGEIHLSTVILFDLGVFALVVGATILILIALAHQSRRSYRTIGTGAGALRVGQGARSGSAAQGSA